MQELVLSGEQEAGDWECLDSGRQISAGERGPAPARTGVYERLDGGVRASGTRGLGGRSVQLERREPRQPGRVTAAKPPLTAHGAAPEPVPALCYRHCRHCRRRAPDRPGDSAPPRPPAPPRKWSAAAADPPTDPEGKHGRRRGGVAGRPGPGRTEMLAGKQGGARVAHRAWLRRD